MCPACMASAALVAGSVMSTGGVAALAVKMVRGKKNSDPKNNSTNVADRRNDDGNDERSNDE
jgi:hypothetical protein